ncbi:MAG: hypothetical protein ACTHOR_17845 [Devosia sp.]
MLAFIAFIKPFASAIGAVAGWALADWKRIVALLAVLALVGAYVVGDVRGRQAEAKAWQAKYDAQAKAFIAAADRAATEEHNRQVTAVAAAQADFDKQMRARDKADAEKTAALDKEIASYEAQLAKAGRSCPITPDDLQHLGVLNAKP